MTREIKIELSDEEIKFLTKIKNYFGDNDKTPFEHTCFFELNKLIEKIKHTTNGE